MQLDPSSLDGVTWKVRPHVADGELGHLQTSEGEPPLNSLCLVDVDDGEGVVDDHTACQGRVLAAPRPSGLIRFSFAILLKENFCWVFLLWPTGELLPRLAWRLSCGKTCLSSTQAAVRDQAERLNTKTSIEEELASNKFTSVQLRRLAECKTSARR